MNQGIEVRETVNQGFIHAELGSGADDKALSVYCAAEISPLLLERNAVSAIENYSAAIACYLRAVPGVTDGRSSQLLREEIDRLLKRLEQMRMLSKEAERLQSKLKAVDFYREYLLTSGMNNGQPIKISDADRLNLATLEISAKDLIAELDSLDDSEEEEPVYQPWTPLFKEGDNVEVLQSDNNPNSWRLATVVQVNPEDQEYSVRYSDDMTTETSVNPQRLRQPKKLEIDEANDSKSEMLKAERLEIVSEILESQRLYVAALKNLKDHYLDPLRKPAHWGGQRETSLFTMKTLNDEEFGNVFGNVEEIVKSAELFLLQLEERFTKWTDEKGLADIFLSFSKAFEGYVNYCVHFEAGIQLLEKMRKERLAIRAIEESARAHKVGSLDNLLKQPRNRISVYRKLVDDLLKRTPPGHPSCESMDMVLKQFKTLELKIDYAKNRIKNQQIVGRIQQQFKPSLKLTMPNRVFIFKAEATVVEKGKSKTRYLWLFNDLLVYGRSSWLSPGFFRHVGSIGVYRYGSAFDYGPLALFVQNVKGYRLVLILDSEKTKKLWFTKLEGCTEAIREKSKEEMVREFEERSELFKAADVAPKLPPRPPQPPADANGLPPGWVELYDDGQKKPYYYNEAESVTQWERPS